MGCCVVLLSMSGRGGPLYASMQAFQIIENSTNSFGYSFAATNPVFRRAPRVLVLPPDTLHVKFWVESCVATAPV